MHEMVTIKDIAKLAGDICETYVSVSWLQERLRIGVPQSGFKFGEDDIVPCESTWYGGYRVIRNFNFSVQYTKPTASISQNNLVTAGALHALVELGYCIPSDVSVIGYDNLPDSECAEFPLTTVGPAPI